MIKTLALVLKKQNLGEFDRILTILTPAFGKKRVVVNGVRKPLSKLAGHLDVMMISQVILTENHNLSKVTSALAVEQFTKIRTCLVDIDRATSIIKLVERVVMEDIAQQTLFQLTVDSLVRINQGHNWGNVWCWYLWGMVRYLGIAPTMDRCSNCEECLEDRAYWSEEHQQVWCGSCWDYRASIVLDTRTLKVFRILLRKDYSFIKKVAISDEIILIVEQILLGEITKTIHKSWRDYASLGRDR